MVKSTKSLNGVIDMTIGEALKRFRDENNLSQSAVSEKLGIQQPSYQRYESGKTMPLAAFIVKMAKAFDVSADYLLGLRDTPKPQETGADEVREAREFKAALKRFVESKGGD